ncbi:unnamed protein product [Ectocarpus sp. 13 AM-2016]
MEWLLLCSIRSSSSYRASQYVSHLSNKTDERCLLPMVLHLTQRIRPEEGWVSRKPRIEVSTFTHRPRIVVKSESDNNELDQWEICGLPDGFLAMCLGAHWIRLG